MIEIEIIAGPGIACFRVCLERSFLLFILSFARLVAIALVNTIHVPVRSSPGPTIERAGERRLDFIFGVYC